MLNDTLMSAGKEESLLLHKIPQVVIQEVMSSWISAVSQFVGQYFMNSWKSACEKIKQNEAWTLPESLFDTRYHTKLDELFGQFLWKLFYRIVLSKNRNAIQGCRKSLFGQVLPPKLIACNSEFMVYVTACHVTRGTESRSWISGFLFLANLPNKLCQKACGSTVPGMIWFLSYYICESQNCLTLTPQA